MMGMEREDAVWLAVFGSLFVFVCAVVVFIVVHLP